MPMLNWTYDPVSDIMEAENNTLRLFQFGKGVYQLDMMHPFVGGREIIANNWKEAQGIAEYHLLSKIIDSASIGTRLIRTMREKDIVRFLKLRTIALDSRKDKTLEVRSGKTEQTGNGGEERIKALPSNVTCSNR